MHHTYLSCLLCLLCTEKKWEDVWLFQQRSQEQTVKFSQVLQHAEEVVGEEGSSNWMSFPKRRKDLVPVPAEAAAAAEADFGVVMLSKTLL